MKEYYIYDSEFRELKRTGAIATILFGAASACLGFAVNAYVGMAFAAGVAEPVLNQWATYKNVAFALSAVFYLFAVLAALSGYNEVERIKAETYHGVQKYKPKSRYKIALWALVFIACVAFGIAIRPAFGL